MKTPLESKKEITNDWISEFPQLSVYSSMKLYAVLDIAIIGIELLSGITSGNYRPYIVYYPLWNASNKDNWSNQIILQEVYDKKGLQFNMPYNNHQPTLKEAVECTRKQALSCLDVPVSVKSIQNLIDHQFSDLLVSSSPVAQARLYACKLHVALYLNDSTLISMIQKEIERASDTWEPRFFEWRYGKVCDWKKDLYKVLDNRNEFLNQIKQNRSEKKISKLNSLEMIY